jgi:hypothetical protein
MINVHLLQQPTNQEFQYYNKKKRKMFFNQIKKGPPAARGCCSLIANEAEKVTLFFSIHAAGRGSINSITQNKAL